jgi:hypothetical protein
MHLEGPWLSTTGKKKGKKKFASSEHAKKSRELDNSWQELLKKYDVEAETKRKNRALSAPPLVYTLSTPAHRSTRHIPSVKDTHLGAVSSKPVQHYTGTKMIGIGTLHKSNAVPVFSDDEAIDMAKMRR